MLQRSQASIPETNVPQGHTQTQSDASRSLNMCSRGVSDAGNPSQYNQNAQGNAGCSDFVADNTLSSMRPWMRLESLEELAKQNGLTTSSKASHQSPQGLINRLNRYVGPLTPATSTTSYSAGSDKRNTSADYPLESEAQLEEYLECYRTNMVSYLPIVCMSPDTTVAELRKQRPFLFLVIRAICSKNLDRQAALVLEFKKMLGSEMLVKGTKNVDLFLGILIFAGWCHPYICNKPIVSTIVHLAMSLAFDLGLTKPLPSESNSVMLNYTAQGCPKPTNGMILMRTMEERRAVIGLYLVSSV
jgi:hypothetical protein